MKKITKIILTLVRNRRIINNVLTSCLLLLFLIYFPSCNFNKKKTVTSKEQFAWANFKEAKLKKAFLQRFEKTKDFDPICHTNFEYFDTLRYYYSKNNFKSLWSVGLNKNNNLDTILYYLRNAEKEHGIDTNTYDLGYINIFHSNYHKKIKSDSSLDYYALANLELFLSNALMRYWNHLQYGVVNPKKLFPEIYQLPLNKRDSLNFFKVLQAIDIGALLRNIQPKNKPYLQLRGALNYFRAFAEKGGWDTIPINDPKLKIQKNDSSNLLPSIAQRLAKTGELDTSDLKRINYQRYDTILLRAVIKFQQQLGLLDDGVIGMNTIKELNATVFDRINQIKVHIERCRWCHYPDSSCYVKVNIPDFRLFACDSGKVMLSMKICCGKKKDKEYDKKMEKYLQTHILQQKPNNHESPNVFSRITHFIINPQWNVPTSIVDREIIYKILADSNYIRDNNFKIFLGDVEINPKTVNWKKYRNGAVPYKFRQESGEINALGKLKFVFINPFDIYMHDTPAKVAFQRSMRAVSHGCIRLEKPMEFAEFLSRSDKKFDLNNVRLDLGQKPLDYSNKDKEKESEKNWAQKQADKKKYDDILKKYEEIKTNKGLLKTIKVFLKKPVPVYVDYYTTWVDDKKSIQFRSDVYSRDKLIWNAMNSNW